MESIYLSTTLQLEKTEGGAASREKENYYGEQHANSLLEHARKWMHTHTHTHARSRTRHGAKNANLFLLAMLY